MAEKVGKGIPPPEVKVSRINTGHERRSDGHETHDVRRWSVERTDERTITHWSEQSGHSVNELVPVMGQYSQYL